VKYPIHPEFTLFEYILEFTLIRILHSQLFKYSNNSNTIPKTHHVIHALAKFNYICIFIVDAFIPATMQLRDPKTNARCDISGTVTELSNGKWNDKKVKQNVIF
jgi:hypothetical protein